MPQTGSLWEARALGPRRTPALDPEPGGLAPQLGDRHRARSAARPLRRSALARGGLRTLAAQRRPGALRQLRDRALLTRARLGLLDVLARSFTLLLRGHGSTS